MDEERLAEVCRRCLTSMFLRFFPRCFASFTGTSICKRAIDAGMIGVSLYNFRDYTLDKHRRVDDAPFGGGAGMLIAPQSVFDCFDAVQRKTGRQTGTESSICLQRESASTQEMSV